MLCQRYSFGQGRNGMIVRFTRRMDINSIRHSCILIFIRRIFSSFAERSYSDSNSSSTLHLLNLLVAQASRSHVTEQRSVVYTL